MSSRALCTIVILLTLLSVSKAACTKAAKKGRGFLQTCNDSRLDIDIQKHLASTISTNIIPSFYTVVFLIGLPANGIALWVLIFKAKKIPSTLLLINLAAADLLLMLALPFKIAYHFLGNNWIFGDAMCIVVTAVFYGNMYCSIFFLTAISIDRYFALVHPFYSKGLRGWRSSTSISIGIWLAVIAGVSAFFFVPQTKTFIIPDITTCHEVWVHCSGYDWYTKYFIGLFIVGFVIPLVVILFCYVPILVTLAKKKGSHRHVIRLLLLVLLIFILCFTPSNILLILHYLETDRECHNQLYLWYIMALSVTTLNSCIDPFIYYYMSNDFWTMVKDTLCISKEGNRESTECTKRSRLPLSSDSKEIVRTGA
ncbi:proteinase-activated receptor 3-like [Mixophyes fleayi]|uniref:proteinase-activated receptor 3-like n=1 Tax=Mixophyes fleayi TaxID=3061075 RepID=UPI003F4D8AAB